MLIERPILMSTPMVQAILKGNKTQTRRLVKPQPSSFSWPKCRYGVAGDRLWVKEAWSLHHFESGPEVAYHAGGDHKKVDRDTVRAAFKTRMAHSSGRPSLHMFRWASRITLEITEVRLQRLQEITHGDCMAEGIIHGPAGSGIPCFKLDGEWWGNSTAIGRYQNLWESINGKGTWEANPYVWAITFRRVQ